MQGERLTIKEFAARAGVSTQAIYQRLAKGLQRYLHEFEGKKYLDEEALSFFEAEKALAKDDANEASGLVSALQESLRVLAVQLEVKDGQLKVKDEQIAALNERLREAQELNRNSQILLGVEQKQGGFFKRLFKRG